MQHLSCGEVQTGMGQRGGADAGRRGKVTSVGCWRLQGRRKLQRQQAPVCGGAYITTSGRIQDSVMNRV